MEQIFSELEQFGIKLVNPEELKKGYKYMLLGFGNSISCDDSLIKFSEKINQYIGNEKQNKSKSKKTEKKVVSKKSVSIKNESIKTNVTINIFSYAKYLGIYKGIPKIYKNKYLHSSNKYSYSTSDSESDSDNEMKPNLVESINKSKNQYEYVEKGLYFEKNGDILIYNVGEYNNDIKLFLFEVDNSFSDQNYLNIILSVISNCKFERDRFIKVICSNQDITLELTHKSIPSAYDSSLDFDKKKKYSLGEDFIFFN